MDKCIGLLILNGCHPKPQVDQWFLRPQQCPVFGNNIGLHFFRIGVRRSREFKRFFCMYDARIHPAMPQATDKLFKIRIFLKHLLDNFKMCWTPGKSFSIDEQTIGFQGRHADKLRINFKKIGDGFMCDAICECGYTYSFIFRHDEVPEIIHDLSKTSKRVLHLIQQVPND